MDPSRKKIEPRRADHVAVGEVIVDENGRRFEVESFYTVIEGHTTFDLMSPYEGNEFLTVHTYAHEQEVMVVTDNGATH